MLGAAVVAGCAIWARWNSPPVDELAEFEAAMESTTVEGVFSTAELAKYDGKDGSPGTYLGIVGLVYDVAAGKEFYGPGQGYSFFAGVDGSSAFITGDFSKKGLHDNLDGLAPEEVVSLFEWVNNTYETKYKRVGVLCCTFYDALGRPTAALKDLYMRRDQGLLARSRQESLAEEFPSCDSKWTRETGGQVMCPIDPERGWTGSAKRFPRLFFGGSSERCACVTEDQFNDSRLKLYDNCKQSQHTCAT